MRWWLGKVGRGKNEIKKHWLFAKVLAESLMVGALSLSSFIVSDGLALIAGDKGKIEKLVQMAWTFVNDRCGLSVLPQFPLTKF